MSGLSLVPILICLHLTLGEILILVLSVRSTYTCDV